MLPKLPPSIARLACLLALMSGVPAAQAGELIVSAASSLGNAMREIAPSFEARHPGTRLLFNFAASDTLLAQIDKGAPVDVFAAADMLVMDRAEQRGLLRPGSRRNFVGNTMVVVKPRNSGLPLQTLADLKSDQVTHVALGRPEGVPAGRYARAALTEAGLWPAIEPKAVYAQNVRQSLDYVARGEVQAGFVYASDAASMQEKVSVAFSVPTRIAVDYPVAIVASTRQPEAAQQFIAHLGSAPVQAVFTRHGFVSR